MWLACKKSLETPATDKELNAHNLGKGTDIKKNSSLPREPAMKLPKYLTLKQ
jgi:hypothetical protein